MKRWAVAVVILTYMVGISAMAILAYRSMPLDSPVVASENITQYVEVEKIIYRDRIVRVVEQAPIEVIREVIVTQNVTTEKIVYTNISTRQWESVEQCEAWIKDHLINLWIVGDKLANCNDYSRIMQDTAMQEGYPISQALTWDTLYYGKTVNHINNGHAGNMVLINGVYYWFDPNPEYYRGLVKITEVAK